MLVQVDPNEHAKNAEDVHLDTEPESEFHENEIDGEWGADARSEVRGENTLNRALWSHDMKNFPKNSSE